MLASLGRVYPSDVQSLISNVSQNLDELMASTERYREATGEDISPSVRDLNARLVNEVIISSDDIDDEEAMRRLRAIQDGIFQTLVLFRAAGVTVAGYEPEATVEDIAVLPMEQAEAMAAQFRTAWDVYPGLVERYGRLRALAASAGASALADFDVKISALDRDILWVQEAFAGLEAMVAEGGSAVRIARPTYNRMRGWVARVFQADEALKRVEGMAEGRGANPDPSLPGMAVPWWGVAAIGAVVVAALFVALEA